MTKWMFKDSNVRTLNCFVCNQANKPSGTTFFHQLIDNLLNDIDDLQGSNVSWLAINIIVIIIGIVF